MTTRETAFSVGAFNGQDYLKKRLACSREDFLKAGKEYAQGSFTSASAQKNCLDGWNGNIKDNENAFYGPCVMISQDETEVSFTLTLRGTYYSEELNARILALFPTEKRLHPSRFEDFYTYDVALSPDEANQLECVAFLRLGDCPGLALKVTYTFK